MVDIKSKTFFIRHIQKTYIIMNDYTQYNTHTMQYICSHRVEQASSSH